MRYIKVQYSIDVAITSAQPLPFMTASPKLLADLKSCFELVRT